MEKKLVTEIKRTAKTGNEATTKISACQLINLRQQITKLQACLQQMSPTKQTEEETEKLTNQVLDEIGFDLSVSPKGRIVGKTTKDANRMKRKVKTFKAPCIMDEALHVRASPSLPCTIDGASSPYVSRMKRKRKTFKAPCIMDEALRVRASPSLPCTIDGASSPYVSSMKRKRKTFKVPCTIDEAVRVRASPSLPRTMDGASSSSVLSPYTVSTTLTRRGRGFARGIKEWGTGTKIQVKFDDKFQPVEDDGKKLKGQLGLIVRSGHRVPLTYLRWNVMHDNLVYCPDEFKEVCMRLCRTSWKDHKSKTKSKYWVPFKNDPDIASRVPSNIVPTQWRKLVQYWASKEVQSGISWASTYDRKDIFLRYSFQCIDLVVAPKASSVTTIAAAAAAAAAAAPSALGVTLVAAMTHKGERIDKMSLWKRAHNLNDPDVVAIVEEYNAHLWKVPKEQHMIEYCDGFYHKILGNDGHGYCKTYGRGVPWNAVYARGSGPSQSLAAPSFIDEIAQHVTQDVESRFTTMIKNLTARVLFLESQGMAGSMSLREMHLVGSKLQKKMNRKFLSFQVDNLEFLREIRINPIKH
ncbi:unnamed protein product [Camellia sinensis]